MKVKSLFGEKLEVVNIGVNLFAEALKQQGVIVAQVAWRPPLNQEIENLLRKVL